MNNMQAPGQAAPAALPTMLAQQNGAAPPPQVGQLSQMPVEQLKQLFFQTMQGSTTVPPLSILAAIKTASERQRMQQAVMGQAAQQQAAQQPGTVRDEVLAQAQSQGGIQALASGGPVQSFAEGGTNIEAILRKAPAARTPEENEALRRAGYTMIENRIAPDSGIARLNAALTRPFIREAITAGAYTLSPEELDQRRDVSALNEKIFRALGGSQYVPDVPTASAPAAAPADQTRPTPQEIERAVRTAPAGVAALPAAPGRAAPAAPAAAAAPGRAAPAAGGIAAVAKPDKLSEIEGEYEAANKGLQALLQQQGQVDPELARLRQAAYESAQGIATRRERDRLAALEAAQKATTAPLLSNQQALLEMAAAASGKKRIGEALGAAAGAAGKIRGEQGKALEAAQKMSREEQNAIDQLNQALAEKRVADRSGDVDRQRQAAIAVEQAKANLADKRLGVHTQRATEADRAEQRKIAREQIAAQLQAARENAAAKESTASLAEQRLAIQAMRADPSYAGIVKELTDAKKLAGVSNSPTFQARVRAAEAAARNLATAYGVTPAAMGMAFGSGASSAGAVPATAARVVDFSSIK